MIILTKVSCLGGLILFKDTHEKNDLKKQKEIKKQRFRQITEYLEAHRNMQTEQN